MVYFKYKAHKNHYNRGTHSVLMSMENFKPVTEIIGDLWLILSSLGLLAYHNLRLHFRVGSLERSRELEAESKKIQDEKLDRINERIENIYHLLVTINSRNHKVDNDSEDNEDNGPRNRPPH